MAYWGKVIGTVAGLATLRPWLALLGLVIGHQFDRGFAERYSRLGAGTRIGRLPEPYVRGLFGTMGHMAKADGRVTEDEIRAARTTMHRLGLGPKQVRHAIDWFQEGKDAAFPLVDTLRGVKRECARNAELKRLFVLLLLEVSLSKGRFGQMERGLLWRICGELDVSRVDLAQMEAMLRAQRGFRRSPAGTADAERLDAAYATLGVAKTASNDEIKRAYRRLMNRNHPDKLVGQRDDAEAIALAQKRTRDIRGAYEMLKVRRSIR